MADERISIFINGERRDWPAGTELVALVEGLGLSAQGVLVEHNGTALRRDEWPVARLAAGDRLEILRVVAGG